MCLLGKYYEFIQKLMYTDNLNKTRILLVVGCNTTVLLRSSVILLTVTGARAGTGDLKSYNTCLATKLRY